jgi:hypothetical protein
MDNAGKMQMVYVGVYVIMDTAVQIVKHKEYHGIVQIVWDLINNGPQEKIKMVCAFARLVIGKVGRMALMDMFNVFNVLVIMAL